LGATARGAKRKRSEQDGSVQRTPAFAIHPAPPSSRRLSWN
jgi:hypothetical protein